MTRTSDAPVDLRAELEAELAALEARHKQLRVGLAEFQHSGRRVADGLERAGGREAGLERRRAALISNERLTRKELEETDKAIKEIRRALARHTADKGDGEEWECQ